LQLYINKTQDCSLPIQQFTPNFRIQKTSDTGGGFRPVETLTPAKKVRKFITILKVLAVHKHETT
jgi:hypothetical protein